MSRSLFSLFRTQEGWEQFALVALLKKEKKVDSLFFCQKRAIRTKNLTKIVFFEGFFKKNNLINPSFLMSDVSKFLRSLTKNERCEQIAQGPHQKWASMRDMLRLLTKNEQPWASHSGAHQKWANDWITRFFVQFERNPKSEFPTLPTMRIFLYLFYF